METKEYYISYIREIVGLIKRKYGSEWQQYQVEDYILNLEDLKDAEIQNFILKFTKFYPHSWNISQVAFDLRFRRDTRRAMAYLALKDDVIYFLENFGEEINESELY